MYGKKFVKLRFSCIPDLLFEVNSINVSQITVHLKFLFAKLWGEAKNFLTCLLTSSNLQTSQSSYGWDSMLVEILSADMFEREEHRQNWFAVDSVGNTNVNNIKNGSEPTNERN